MPLQESHCFGDRLRSNRSIIDHGVARRLAHARAESVRVKGFQLAIDEERRSAWPNQNKRTLLRARVFGVEAQSRQTGNRPSMVGAQIGHGFDRGRKSRSFRVS